MPSQAYVGGCCANQEGWLAADTAGGGGGTGAGMAAGSMPLLLRGLRCTASIADSAMMAASPPVQPRDIAAACATAYANDHPGLMSGRRMQSLRCGQERDVCLPSVPQYKHRAASHFITGFTVIHAAVLPIVDALLAAPNADFAARVAAASAAALPIVNALPAAPNAVFAAAVAAAKTVGVGVGACAAAAAAGCAGTIAAAAAAAAAAATACLAVPSSSHAGGSLDSAAAM